MKIDTSVWNNIERLRDRLNDMSKTLISFCLVGVFQAISYIQYSKWNYMFLGIMGIGALTGILSVISKIKWDKEVPKEEDERK